jgi:hypothetical protein
MAAMILLQKHYLTGTEISHGLNAFILVCRDKKTEMMRLDYDTVCDALLVSRNKTQLTNVLC